MSGKVESRTVPAVPASLQVPGGKRLRIALHMVTGGPSMAIPAERISAFPFSRRRPLHTAAPHDRGRRRSATGRLSPPPSISMVDSRACLPVDVAPEPGQQRFEILPVRCASAATPAAHAAGEQLRRGEGAQGVGGEVPHQASEPMDILHAAVAIVSRSP